MKIYVTHIDKDRVCKILYTLKTPYEAVKNSYGYAINIDCDKDDCNEIKTALDKSKIRYKLQESNSKLLNLL